MLDIVIALGLTVAEKVFGRSEKTTRLLVEYEQMNKRSDRVMNDIAHSTDEMMAQISLRGRLVAESIKNDNLRQFKKIERERLQILS